MLSKIKSSTMAETRSSISHASQASDNEDNEIDNDTNNNNNNNINNNQQSKKTQDELLDIVEVSRKRRLSKDSADSLTSFIMWSFSHIDPSIQRLTYTSNKNSSDDTINQEQLDEDMLDEDDWSTLIQQQQQQEHQFTNSRFQVPEHLLRQHAKLLGASSGANDGAGGGGAGGGGSSAANLALLKNNERHHLSLGSMLSESARGNKRARTHVYSPESKFSPVSSQLNNSSPRKSSNYLGNVVERLHHNHHHHHHHQQQQQPPAQQGPQQDIDQEVSSNAGLSFHLQQFLQQQTSLEDLCSSVGLDDSNQLVLAAAIHRALVDSVGPNQLGPAGDTKSIASSTGSSSGGSSNNNNNNSNINNSNSNNNNNLGSANLNPISTMNASGANLHLVDSMSRQRRAYNTRAALHGIIPTNRQSVAINMSNRVQQQRHAQAAAALSALASAGSHSLHLTSTTPTTPIVDFKCDTCPSSFDDRHRLMQHQSIHLELKKDWFTETPVDEVMKIFNRRRGEFLCNICNLRFEATLDYDQHNHSVHGPRPYCCQFCGNGTRTFKCWRQYLNHLYDHRYIFSCTIDDCDFTVNRRDSLRFHIFRFHLNCQLPQNQQQLLRGGHNLMVGSANLHGLDSKWPTMEDEDEDTENEMNVAD